MKEQRPKLQRGQDPIRDRLKGSGYRDVDALMRDTPSEKDELDKALPGAAARAREQALPLEQRKQRRHEQREPGQPRPTPEDEATLDALVDGLTPEQREQLHERLLQHAVHDEGWNFSLDDDEDEPDDDETGEEL